MRRLILTVNLALLISLPRVVPAKPSRECEADLTMVSNLLRDHHLEIKPQRGCLFVMSFDQPNLRSRKAARVLDSVIDGKCRNIEAFVDTLGADHYRAPVVRSRAELDQRRLRRFETARFLLIDTVESFLYDVTPAERDANLTQLRELLVHRVRGQRATLLVLERPDTFERYLAKLSLLPKSLESSVSK